MQPGGVCRAVPGGGRGGAGGRVWVRSACARPRVLSAPPSGRRHRPGDAGRRDALYHQRHPKEGCAMKGLLLKDWFVLRQYSPMLVLVLAVYAALDWAGGGGMMAALCMGLCAALPLSVLSANRPCRWDAFAQCLPVSRGVRVLETYAFTALLLAASLLAGVALSVPSWMQ